MMDIQFLKSPKTSFKSHIKFVNKSTKIKIKIKIKTNNLLVQQVITKLILIIYWNKKLVLIPYRHNKINTNNLMIKILLSELVLPQSQTQPKHYLHKQLQTQVKQNTYNEST